MTSGPRHGGSRGGAGRPKGPVPERVRLFCASQASLARRYAEEALSTLATIMRDERVPDGVRLKATKEILNRSHGRPSTQPIEQPASPRKDPESEDEIIEELRRRGLLELFTLTKPPRYWGR